MSAVPSSEVTVSYSRIRQDLFVTWWHPKTRQRLTMIIRDYSSPMVDYVSNQTNSLCPKELARVTVVYPGQLDYQGSILTNRKMVMSKTPSEQLYFDFPDQSVFPLGSDCGELRGWLQEMSHLINVDYFAKGNF